MILGFIDPQQLVTMLHVFGVVVGMGGAMASDFIFLSSVKDQKISETEMRFLHLGGAMVWSGLIVIVLSGIIIFSTDPAQYLESSKFLAKMTIVGIIVLNGTVFHLVHIPRLRRHIGAHFPSSDEFIRKSTLLIASGAISVTSWISALVLGSLRHVPYAYSDIMFVYLGVLGAAVIGAVIFRKPVLGF